MENKKTKKTKLEKFLNSWGFMIILNLIVIATFTVAFIESAFWKEVPYNAQHLTKDLSTYLIYFRTILAVFLGLFLIIINASYITARPIHRGSEDKGKDKDQKENDDDNADSNQ